MRCAVARVPPRAVFPGGPREPIQRLESAPAPLGHLSRCRHAPSSPTLSRRFQPGLASRSPAHQSKLICTAEIGRVLGEVWPSPLRNPKVPVPDGPSPAFARPAPSFPSVPAPRKPWPSSKSRTSRPTSCTEAWSSSVISTASARRTSAAWLTASWTKAWPSSSRTSSKASHGLPGSQWTRDSRRGGSRYAHASDTHSWSRGS